MKEKIVNELIRYFRDSNFPEALPEYCQAQYIAEKFKIKRNTASKHLNELTEKGKLIKVVSRPVIFLPKEEVEEKLGISLIKYEYESLQDLLAIERTDSKRKIFAGLIGYKDSLRDAVEYGIAAMKYPNGLPIIYFGSSGVGKSYLVEKIANYCRTTGIIEKDAPFLVLNCAQYYNNPELLTSQLFGYMKGAFTGADNDHVGIIEAANGGILFLDEIHRLSPEGQEKLFLHLDKGIFHRIGDNGPWRKSQVRYIFATTEEQNNSFLETFVRRIPIVCNLPDYKNRSTSERREIIFYLFEKESNLIEKEIFISEAALTFLIRLDLIGNIGELEGLIKQTIAKKITFDEYNRYIEIHIEDFPKRYLLAEKKQIPNKFYGQKLYVFSNGNYVQEEKSEDSIIRSREILFRKVLESFKKNQDGEIKEAEFRLFVSNALSDYNDKFMFNQKTELLSKFYLPELQKIIQRIAPSLFIHLQGNTVQQIAFYLNFRKQWIDGEALIEQKDAALFVDYITEHFIRDLEVINLFIENSLDIILSFWDRLYIAACLFCSTNDEANKVGAIILAHGYATASSIANVANRFAQKFVFDSIDMPFDIPVNEVIERLLHYLEGRMPKEGLIIFVDMGSLAMIKEDIQEYIEVPTLIINNVTTEMAIETALMIKQDHPIENIVENLSTSVFEKQLIFPEVERKRTIIVSCGTGFGTAIKLKEMLEKYVPKELGIEFIPYETEHLTESLVNDYVHKTKDVIAIIGTENPKISRIPYISLEELFQGEVGKLYMVLEKLYGKETAETVNQNIIKNSTLNRLIDSLTILDAEKVLEQIDDCFEHLETVTSEKIRMITKINLYVHISCMIERLIRNQPIQSYPKLNELNKYHQMEIQNIKQSFQSIENLYNIEVPIEEIGYVYNIYVN